MVRIGFHFSRPEIRCRHWHDLQTVGQLTGFSPDSGDFVDQCFQTVRLVAAQVAEWKLDAHALMAALLVHAGSKCVVALASGGWRYALAVAPGVLAHTLAFVGVLALQ